MASSIVTSEMRAAAKRPRAFKSIYGVTLLFSLHWALVAYVNSAFLSQFVSDRIIGALYTLASVLTIIAFFFSGRVLSRFGNRRTAFALGAAETLILAGLAITSTPSLGLPLFVLHHAIVPFILLNLDVFTEDRVGAREGITGGTRGIMLVTLSSGTAFATLAAGFLLGGGTPRFAAAYLASAMLMGGFCYFTARGMKSFRDPVYSGENVLDTFYRFLGKHSLRLVFICHFLLQLFFAWMVVYVPLYLASTIGFSWDEIGLVLFVGLFAYVLLEYPIGLLADQWIGEKEMMGAGFIVLAISTMYMAFLKVPILLPWMVTMFMTRVGASLVEVTTESYFFKHTKDADASLIGFFRACRPLAFLLGSLLGSVMLVYLPFNYLFVVFGLLMLPGVVFALLLKDTR